MTNKLLAKNSVETIQQRDTVNNKIRNILSGGNGVGVQNASGSQIMTEMQSISVSAAQTLENSKVSSFISKQGIGGFQESSYAPQLKSDTKQRIAPQLQDNSTV